MIFMAFGSIALLVALLIVVILLTIRRSPRAFRINFKSLKQNSYLSRTFERFQNKNECESQIRSVTLELTSLKEHTLECAEKIESLSDSVEILKRTNKDSMIEIVALVREVGELRNSTSKSPGQLKSYESKALEDPERQQERLWMIREKKLMADLRKTKGSLERSRQLYNLLKSLLEKRARSLEDTIGDRNLAPVIVGVDDNNSQACTESRLQASTAIEFPCNEPNQSTNNPEHQYAARIARVIVRELFLYNSDRIESSPGKNIGEISAEEIQEILGPQIREARATFDSRVAQNVWGRDDYFKAELERVIQERYGKRRTEFERTTSEVDTRTKSERRLKKTSESRVAEEMVADLFLSNWNLVEEGIREGEIRKLFEVPYRKAREKFGTLMNRPNDAEANCFDTEYEQILTTRFKQLNTESTSIDLRSQTHSENAPAVINDEREHDEAAQIAKKMLDDLFLSNQNLVEKKPLGDSEFERLRTSFESICKKYESCVPERIWRNNHYLKFEYARMIKERFVHSDCRQDNVKSIKENAKQDNWIPSLNGSDHLNAARTAKVIVSDLFSKNRDLIKKGMSQAEIRELLKDQYRVALVSFESRVPERIWKKRNDLEIEFEKALQEYGEDSCVDDDFAEVFREKFSL